MTTLASSISYTPADIARLSDQDGKHYELFDGELVEKPTSMRANYVATNIAHVLCVTYRGSRAYVFIKQPVYCFSTAREMRVPDVSMVWAHRLPGGLTDDELHIAPDLAVEVVSPTNTYYAVHSRIDEYLDAGVGIVWVVGPVQRDVFVYRNDGTLNRYRGAEELKNEALLPGLVFKVADIFPAVSSEPRP